MQELRKVQVFDCWRRLRNITQAQHAKLEQAVLILQQRKLTRILGKWKVQLLEQQCEELGSQIAERLRLMKLRHCLFGRWVFAINVKS
jgi:hypothetical protein